MRFADSSKHQGYMGMAVGYTVHAEVSSACKTCVASSTPAQALQRLSCLDYRFYIFCRLSEAWASDFDVSSYRLA